VKNLLTAYAKAQSDFLAVKKTATNPAFRSKYATLEDVQNAIEDSLAKHGLVVIQSLRTEFTESGPVVYVRATLYHIESEEGTFTELGLMPVKLDPQSMGSAITYGRRYVLMTMFGLVGEDDDGNQASGYKPQQQQYKPTPPPPSAQVSAQVSAQAMNTAAVAAQTKAQPWQTWASSADAANWAVSTPAYEDVDEAMRIFKGVYLATVKDKKAPTDAEKAQAFERFYTQTLESLDK
jgi:hypothetical protein